MKTAAIAILFLLLTAIASSIAYAQPTGSGSDVVAVGSGSAAPTAAATPPVLHDPIAAPIEAVSDLKQAKRQGWAALAFAVLVMLTRLGVRASERYKSLAFLGKGNAHIALAATAAFALAAYNALALGGSLYAALYAAGGVALYAIMPQPKPAAAA